MSSIYTMLRRVLRLHGIACALCFAVVVSGNLLYAQEDPGEPDRDDPPGRAAEDARQAAEAQRLADEDFQKMRERSGKLMEEFLNDTPNSKRPWEPSQDRRRRFAAFKVALREFDGSTGELSQAASFGSKLSLPARKLEESTKTLLDFIKLINKKHPRLDPAEFKAFTSQDLAKETLATASRIVPHLKEVVRNEGETSLDINYLASLPQLELDLLRLQWMAHRVR